MQGTNVDARARLVNAARRRFAEYGAVRPALDEVRRDAGVSVGALYHHFPDKQALAAAVFAQLIGEYQAGFLEKLTAQSTAEGGIRGGVIYHLRWVGEHRHEARLLLGDRPESHELADINSKFFAAVRGWWRPHHTYGVLRAMQPGVTSALWLGPAQEFTRYWVTSAESKIAPKTVATFASAAWATLRQQEDG